jgi:trimeric autotransporter adhesin
MKKIITYLLVIVPSFFFCTINLFSQSLAVNTDGSVAHSSSILDIKSSTKGMLAPRMTTAQRTAIAAPAAGLFVYDTDTNSFWYYGGTIWTNLAVVGPTTSWLLTGNTGTDPNLNFIGTSDSKPLRFRIQNSWAGELGLNGNVSLGYRAGESNSASQSNDNTAIGNFALQKNTTASRNIAIGARALFTQSFSDGGTIWASNNVAIGIDALRNNNPDVVGNGFKNIAVGNSALKTNSTGYSNTAMGFEALNSNTTGYLNIAIGETALYFNSSGNHNIAIGDNALYTNKTGNFNTAIGSTTLYKNEIGGENTAIGYSTLLNNTGEFNTASGSRAMLTNTVGIGNTASGWEALYSNTVGSNNTADGFLALAGNLDGGNNSAIGGYTLYNNDHGNGNTAMGWNALLANRTGNENTGVGIFSNTALINLSNATAVGARAVVNATNKMQLGNTNTLLISTSGGYAITSDGRFKENLQADVKGLDFIMKLRPVTYNFNYASYDQFIQPEVIETVNESNKLKENPAMLQKIADGKNEYQHQLTNRSAKRETGFVAQEVEKAVNESGYTSFNGVYAPTNAKDNYSLDYSKMVVPLVKAVQEQQQMIDELKKINQELLRRLEALEKRKL